ncbi:MAG: hypothetical protein WBA41_02375 [Rivularia sp. (in: cyanobacteria)]
MIDFKNILKLRATILCGLLIITLCFGIAPQAIAATKSPIVRTLDNSKRIQAIAACLPAQLTIQEEDAGERIARAFSEMKNDQLERIFDVTDTPKLSDAEVEFKTCLRQKGFTPQAELSDRSFY